MTLEGVIPTGGAKPPQDSNTLALINNYSAFVFVLIPLLTGDYRDSMVGRDLLVGFGSSVFVMIIGLSIYLLASFLSILQDTPSTEFQRGGILNLGPYYLLKGTPAIVATVLKIISYSIQASLLMCFIFFLARVLFRRTWIALAAFMAIWVVLVLMIPGINNMQTLVLFLKMGVGFGIPFFMLFRFGLLAMAVFVFYGELLNKFPIAALPSSWYFPIGLAGFALSLAFALYAFHTSLGNQPLFGRASLED